jgi:hypothetical protein
MHVPAGPLNLSLAEAATRQTKAAIAALERGMFDVAMTLAGAAEGMIKRDGPHMFQGLRAHPRALKRFSQKNGLQSSTWSVTGSNMEAKQK